MPQAGKCGALAPKADHPRLFLSRYLDPAAIPPAPDSLSWTPKVVGGFPCWYNQTIGDCTAEGVGHLIESWSANAGLQVTPSAESIMALYRAASGYDPSTGANDNGAQLEDVIGIMQTKGLEGNLFGPALSGEPSNVAQIEHSIHLTGGAYMAFQMPRSAMQQFESNQVWDLPWGYWFEPTPDGHCVAFHGYDRATQLFELTTWGTVWKATYRWVAYHCVQWYSILDPLWRMSNGQVPSGFAYDQVQADQKALFA